MSCVLGLDVGTTSTIGLLIRLPYEALGVASRPVTLSSPQAGWAEEDPREWWDNVCSITRELIATTGIDPAEIAAIGVTGMLPAVVLLDEEGGVLRPSIQQSDARCGAEVTELRAEREEAAFMAKAGNGINQQLVTAKLRWIARHEPAVFANIATVFGSYDYVNWRLTGIRAVEQNWALEAGFVDVSRHALDDDLIAWAGVPRHAVPPRMASHEVMGHVSADGAAQTGLAAGTPVIGGAADMIASALGAGVTARGDVLLKFGGAVDILVATDEVKPDPRLYLDYHLIPGLFMPNGCMSTGGSGLNWFVRNFAGGEREAATRDGLSLHQHLDRLADARPAGADGITILPYFLGEKTPIHDPAARGIIEGLTLSHDIGHVWRAMLESYAYACAHHLEVLRDMGHAASRVLVSDGGSNSRVWMQIVADVLQMRLHRLSGHPGSSLGAAWTAAVGLGLADWPDIAGFVTLDEVLEPNPAHREIYGRGYRRYRELYLRLGAPHAGDGATVLRAVAWDIDGTLVGSEPLHHRALLAACTGLGTDESDLPEDMFRGIPMGEVWTLLQSRLPPGTAEADWPAAIDDYYVASRHALVELPEAVATVRALARLGVPQVYVSNSSRSAVDANLAALSIADALAFSLSLDDGTRGQPDPEPFASAFTRLGLLPSDVVAVEDSRAGARSAQAAGLSVVAYRARGGGVDQADFVIVDLRQVQGLFSSFSARRSHAGAE